MVSESTGEVSAGCALEEAEEMPSRNVKGGAAAPGRRSVTMEGAVVTVAQSRDVCLAVLGVLLRTA